MQDITVRVQCEAEDCGALLEVCGAAPAPRQGQAPWRGGLEGEHAGAAWFAMPAGRDQWDGGRWQALLAAALLRPYAHSTLCEHTKARMEVTLPEAPPGQDGQPAVIIVKCGACSRLLEVTLDSEGTPAEGSGGLGASGSGAPHHPPGSGAPPPWGPDTDPGTGGAGRSGGHSGSIGGHGSTAHGARQGSSGQGTSTPAGQNSGQQLHMGQEGYRTGPGHGPGGMAGSLTSQHTMLPQRYATAQQATQQQAAHQQMPGQQPAYHGYGAQQQHDVHQQPTHHQDVQAAAGQQWFQRPTQESQQQQQQQHGQFHYNASRPQQSPAAATQWIMQQQGSEAQAHGNFEAPQDAGPHASHQGARQGDKGIGMPGQQDTLQPHPAAWTNPGHSAAIDTTRRLQHAISMPASTQGLQRPHPGWDAAGGGLGAGGGVLATAGGSLRGSRGFGKWGSLTRLLFSSDEFDDVLGMLGIEAVGVEDLDELRQGPQGRMGEGHGERGGAPWHAQAANSIDGGNATAAGAGGQQGMGGYCDKGLGRHPSLCLDGVLGQPLSNQQQQLRHCPSAPHGEMIMHQHLVGQSTAIEGVTDAVAVVRASALRSPAPGPQTNMGDEHNLPLLPHALPPGVTLQPLRKPRAKKSGTQGAAGGGGVLSPYNRFVQQEMKRLRQADPNLDHRTALKLAASAWAHYGATLSARLNATRFQMQGTQQAAAEAGAASSSAAPAQAGHGLGNGMGDVVELHQVGCVDLAIPPDKPTQPQLRPTPSQTSLLSGSTLPTPLGTHTGGSPASHPGAAPSVRPQHQGGGQSSSLSHTQSPGAATTLPQQQRQQQQEQWQCWSAQYAEGSGPGLPAGMGPLGLGLGALGACGNAYMISSSRDTPLHVALAKQARSGGGTAGNKVARISGSGVRGAGGGRCSRAFKLPMVPIPEQPPRPTDGSGLCGSSEEDEGGSSCRLQRECSSEGRPWKKRMSEESCTSANTSTTGAVAVSQQRPKLGSSAVPPVITLPYPFCPNVWHPLLREPVHIPRHLPPDSMCQLLLGGAELRGALSPSSSALSTPSAPHSLLSHYEHGSGGGSGSKELSSATWHHATDLLPTCWSSTDTAVLFAEAAAAAAAAIAAAEGWASDAAVAAAAAGAMCEQISAGDAECVTTALTQHPTPCNTPGGLQAQAVDGASAGRTAHVAHSPNMAIPASSTPQQRRAHVRIPDLASLVHLLSTRVLPMM